jgi:hypothetical protein
MAGGVTRNIVAEADRLINAARPEKYGSVEESFTRIAQGVNAIMSREERTGAFTAETVAKVLVVMKLVRDSYSPDNVDHLTDAIGYLGLLDQVRQSRPWVPGTP